MKQDANKIRAKILGLLGSADYRPLDKVEIARKLGISANDRVALRQSLKQLEHSGAIARIRKNRYVLPDEADLVTGTISIHQSGFGFLGNEKEGAADLFIPAENTGTAMNGDRVVARVTREATRGRGKDHLRDEGRVIRILERVHQT